MQQNQLDKIIEDPLAELEADTKPEVISEKPKLKETIKEKVIETKKELFKKQETKEAKEEQEAKEIEKPPVSAQAATALQPKSQLHLMVEGILEEGLADIYQKMPPDKQKEFKKVGEETASKITQLLQVAKLKLQQIFNLILRWLKIIPDVNQFYLEQEAKIKADRILALKERMKK